jgi:hypothetical protein
MRRERVENVKRHLPSLNGQRERASKARGLPGPHSPNPLEHRARGSGAPFLRTRSSIEIHRPLTGTILTVIVFLVK